MPANIIDQQTRMTPVEEKEWLEYKFFCALQDLKKVAPDHYLVTTVEYAIQSRPTWLKRQAE